MRRTTREVAWVLVALAAILVFIWVIRACMPAGIY
jgi:hypothetical protein